MYCFFWGLGGYKKNQKKENVQWLWRVEHTWCLDYGTFKYFKGWKKKDHITDHILQHFHEVHYHSLTVEYIYHISDIVVLHILLGHVHLEHQYLIPPPFPLPSSCVHHSSWRPDDFFDAPHWNRPHDLVALFRQVLGHLWILHGEGWAPRIWEENMAKKCEKGMNNYEIIQLLGGIPTPLKNMSQLGWHSQYMENKIHVPNHQPTCCGDTGRTRLENPYLAHIGNGHVGHRWRRWVALGSYGHGGGRFLHSQDDNLRARLSAGAAWSRQHVRGGVPANRAPELHKLSRLGGQFFIPRAQTGFQAIQEMHENDWKCLLFGCLIHVCDIFRLYAHFDQPSAHHIWWFNLRVWWLNPFLFNMFKLAQHPLNYQKKPRWVKTLTMIHHGSSQKKLGIPTLDGSAGDFHPDPFCQRRWTAWPTSPGPLEAAGLPKCLGNCGKIIEDSSNIFQAPSLITEGAFSDFSRMICAPNGWFLGWFTGATFFWCQWDWSESGIYAVGVVTAHPSKKKGLGDSSSCSPDGK